MPARLADGRFEGARRGPFLFLCRPPIAGRPRLLGPGGVEESTCVGGLGDGRGGRRAGVPSLGGQSVDFEDAGLNLAYRRALVSIKQTIHPRLGFTPAATNPFDDFHYGYKVWVRDSVVTSMILDLAGFVDDTADYWPWIASKQLPDGDFKYQK